MLEDCHRVLLKKTLHESTAAWSAAPVPFCPAGVPGDDILYWDTNACNRHQYFTTQYVSIGLNFILRALAILDFSHVVAQLSSLYATAYIGHTSAYVAFLVHNLEAWLVGF